MRYVVALLAAFVAVTAFADPQGGGRPDPMQHLTETLQLDSQQASQVQEILSAQRDRMRSLRDSGGDGSDDRRAQMKSIHDDTMKQLSGVLNAEQMQKFQQMEQQRRERMRQKHGQQQAPGT